MSGLEMLLLMLLMLSLYQQETGSVIYTPPLSFLATAGVRPLKAALRG